MGKSGAAAKQYVGKKAKAYSSPDKRTPKAPATNVSGRKTPKA